VAPAVVIADRSRRRARFVEVKEKILSEAIYASELTAIEEYVLRRQAKHDPSTETHS